MVYSRVWVTVLRDRGKGETMTLRTDMILTWSTTAVTDRGDFVLRVLRPKVNEDTYSLQKKQTPPESTSLVTETVHTVGVVKRRTKKIWKENDLVEELTKEKVLLIEVNKNHHQEREESVFTKRKEPEEKTEKQKVIRGRHKPEGLQREGDYLDIIFLSVKSRQILLT